MPPHRRQDVSCLDPESIVVQSDRNGQEGVESFSYVDALATEEETTARELEETTAAQAGLGLGTRVKEIEHRAV